MNGLAVRPRVDNDEAVSATQQMLVAYGAIENMPRFASERLARRLLKTAPAGDRVDSSVFWESMPIDFTAAFMNPGNSLFASIQTQDGGWRGDLIVRQGDEIFTIGTSEREAFQSHHEALDGLLELVGHVKAIRLVLTESAIRNRLSRPRRARR